MKNKKYAEKWYMRYREIEIGCIILNISFVIILLYFLLIEKFFDIILICFFLIMCLFSSVMAISAFIKCKQIKHDINNNE